MPFSVKPHLPLISHRIQFEPSALAPPPIITPRQDLGRLLKRQARREHTPYDRKPGWTAHLELPAPEPSVVQTIDTGSDLTELSDDEGSGHESEEEISTRAKIAKPPGEAGRRNCGSFNLEAAMGWETSRYNNFTKYIADVAAKKLDANKCFSNQNAEAIRDVVAMAARRFKIEGVYQNDWPICEALKLRLKYTSENARRHTQKEGAKNFGKALIAAFAGDEMGKQTK